MASSAGAAFVSGWLALSWPGYWKLASPSASGRRAAFGVSAIVLLSRSLQRIPTSVGYAVFTAIGIVGTTVFDAAIRREHLTAARLASVALILAGVVALRLSTPAGTR